MRLRSLCFALAVAGTAARAETFVVTRFDDPLPAACTPASCSLREAALAADANDPFAPADVIRLAAGTYTLVRGELASGQNLELVGAGSASTSIVTDAALFDDTTDYRLRLRGVRVQTSDYNVLAMGEGGRLELEDVAVPVDGGGVVVGGEDTELDVRGGEFRDSLQCNQSAGPCTIRDSRLFNFYVNPVSGDGPEVLIQRSRIDGSLDPEPALASAIVLHAGASVTLEDSTITGSELKTFGDGPLALTLKRVRYLDNRGPIRVEAATAVTIQDSEFRDNDVRALYAANASTWRVLGSSFVDNQVDGNAGGAIVLEDSVSMRIDNSTFAGNRFSVDAAADGARGAAIGYRNLLAGARLVLRQVTIARPIAMPAGVQGTAIGGYGDAIEIDAFNSVIAGSCRFDAGALDEARGNLESPGASCGFGSSSNQVSVSASELALGDLGAHGGPTPTYLPAEDSAAVDGGEADVCLVLDQRGYARPFGATCDVGAVEVGAGDALFGDGFDG